ncbi:PilW family protein [Cerasicoccus fimbriatus]|uniref:PilW family protein n=1 Tax=Cerasicoccus fimbriatus TaxID=3014554 RepID=UPI0022B54008|nr:prepilin-type N-terminal cleavage/methylation domain-containing protein [Cerasicoccus sp. TK19100]
MERRASVITTRAFSKRTKGFTIMEIMISTALLGFLMAGLVSTFVFMLRSSVSLGNYADMNRDGTYFLERFGREIRMTSNVITAADNSFTIDVDSTSGTERITYSYLSSSGELVRVNNTTSSKKVMLDNISGIKIEYYNILGDLTTNINEVKSIQLRVDLTRNNMRDDNTDHIISARYNMRNRIITN